MMIRVLQQKLGSLAAFRKATEKSTSIKAAGTANDNLLPADEDLYESLQSHSTLAEQPTTAKISAKRKKKEQDKIIQARILLNTRLHTEKLRANNNSPERKADYGVGI